MRRICNIVTVSALFLTAQETAAGELFVRSGIGVGSTFGTVDVSYGGNDNDGFPFVFSVGYGMENRFSVFAEGLYWPIIGFVSKTDWRNPISWIVSANMSYDFFDAESIFRIYAIGGIGFGRVRVWTWPESSLSGPFHILGGVGFGVRATEWLDVLLEGRMRWGLPSYTNVITMYALLSLSFNYEL